MTTLWYSFEYYYHCCCCYYLLWSWWWLPLLLLLLLRKLTHWLSNWWPNEPSKLAKAFVLCAEPFRSLGFVWFVWSSSKGQFDCCCCRRKRVTSYIIIANTHTHTQKQTQLLFSWWLLVKQWPGRCATKTSGQTHYANRHTLTMIGHPNSCKFLLLLVS